MVGSKEQLRVSWLPDFGLRPHGRTNVGALTGRIRFLGLMILYL